MTPPYDRIAESAGFQVPELFRKMTADGVTRYDKPEQWREKPPALLMASAHVEWWQPDVIASWSAPDYYALDFVPFAANGGGDLWCWYPACGTQAVVLVIHDENCAQYHAPDLEGFLFRHMVEVCAEIYDHHGPRPTDEQHIEAAKVDVRTLAPYLRPAWVDLLNELVGRPLTRHKSGSYVSFLTRKEAAEIVKRELAMPNLDESFRYQTDL